MIKFTEKNILDMAMIEKYKEIKKEILSEDLKFVEKYQEEKTMQELFDEFLETQLKYVSGDCVTLNVMRHNQKGDFQQRESTIKQIRKLKKEYRQSVSELSK